MSRKRTTKRVLRKIVAPIFSRIAPERWKAFNEITYWRQRKQAEGNLSHTHYRHYYTDHFGLADTDYAGKVVLDIGCGPRGSLEWADGAARRIGLDPLAGEYLALGADQHAMEYLEAPSEQIPLPDASCDIVCSFNSLDHVADVDRTLAEIKRVTRAGGRFLLLVEINHAPTDCEPHTLGPDIINRLEPEFSCEDLKVYRPVEKGVYRAITANQLDQAPHTTTHNGYLSARLTRLPQP